MYKIIDINGLKFKTHTFVEDILENDRAYVVYSKTCLKCKMTIYYPVYGNGLSESYLGAISLWSFSQKNHYTADCSLSCDEVIIKNIIQ